MKQTKRISNPTYKVHWCAMHANNWSWKRKRRYFLCLKNRLIHQYVNRRDDGPFQQELCRALEILNTILDELSPKETEDSGFSVSISGNILSTGWWNSGNVGEAELCLPPPETDEIWSTKEQLHHLEEDTSQDWKFRWNKDALDEHMADFKYQIDHMETVNDVFSIRATLKSYYIGKVLDGKSWARCFNYLVRKAQRRFTNCLEIQCWQVREGMELKPPKTPDLKKWDTYLNRLIKQEGSESVRVNFIDKRTDNMLYGIYGDNNEE
jgi:hypothetical protein